MTIEKKMIRSDIPGHQNYLNGSALQTAMTGEEASRLIVPRDVAVIGKISACHHLVIEGTVQAESFCAQRIDILEPGLFIGVAEVETAVISGCFEGRLVVMGKLTVKSTGRICGDIEYGMLEMEAGARIEGQLMALPPAIVQDMPYAETAMPMHADQLFETAEESPAEEQPQTFRKAMGY